METSGLTEDAAKQRLKQYGPNVISVRQRNPVYILIRQFTGNPLIIILAAATFISYLLGQTTSSYYIFIIIILSVLLGFVNEYAAEKTIDDLLKKISPTAIVERSGEKKEIPVSEITIGDLIFLSPGAIVPADLQLTEPQNLEIDQAALTGEAKAVHKNDKDKAYMGTTVVSGSSQGIVIAIGRETEFGKIAKAAVFIKPETEFQKGLADFGQLIIKLVIVLTAAIFVINALLGHYWLTSLLFALAIAVGLTPELLPVIVTVSLSRGAGKLAKYGVVVKRLLSLENLGNMDILCTDKTGTLTEGHLDVVDYVDSEGKKNTSVLTYSLLSTSVLLHHKVIGNDIDRALWDFSIKNKIEIDKKFKKIYEVPFDYEKKAMYSVVTNNGETILIVKGSPDMIVSYCGSRVDKKKLLEKFAALNKDGLRAIAVAIKKINKKSEYSWKDIADLDFYGYVSFLDIPKKTAKEALEKLQRLNVEIKIITGDNEIITQKICREVNFPIKKLLLGKDIDKLAENELRNIVLKTNVFAKINPQQKLKIITALRQKEHTVGYMGDGINDVPAIHASDVGISVNSAIDVAKDSASIVLLKKSLDVLAGGILEGRKTFNNTIKYILMAASSNFGNMFSAAGASFFLPFLPATPVQILLTNGLYDISQLPIPSDNVDRESLIRPRHWNINFIRNYMLFFGPLSSIFDFITFAVLIFVFHARESVFQTGWFIESLITQILVVFVIRTTRTPFFFSRPSPWLILTCLLTTATAVLLPFSPLAKTLGLIPPSVTYFLIVIILAATYLLLVEIVKNLFLKRYNL